MPVRDKDFQTAPEQRIAGESGVHEFPDSTGSRYLGTNEGDRIPFTVTLSFLTV
jgi:hypothetical protein